MSGFGNMVVPEQVIANKHGSFWAVGYDCFNLRSLIDGTVHETWEECVAECERLNVGNPFWHSPRKPSK
jgi:hypothetical protein